MRIQEMIDNLERLQNEHGNVFVEGSREITLKKDDFFLVTVDGSAWQEDEFDHDAAKVDCIRVDQSE